MTLREIAPIINLDLERTFALFMGKEDTYVKFLKRFPSNVENLMINLAEAVKNNNYQEVEAAAHGIKGVASNLGILKVSDISSALMLDVRESKFEDIEEHYEKLVEVTKQAIEYIEKLD